MEGIWVIDKPSGISSFGVLQELRKKLGKQKMGYLGTLDPLATGVLVVFLNKATKLIRHFEGLDKEYLVEFELGNTSDTYDVEGRVENLEFRVDKAHLENIVAIIEKHQGKMLQETPKFSAVKRLGKRAYELARKGVEFDLGKRQVEIKELEIIKCVLPRFSVRLVVTSGTYVRSWVNEIGQISGFGAIMTGLRRTKVGDWGEKDSVRLDDASKENLILIESLVAMYGIK
jgi:tRNA pseudouridine55 synthase